MNTQLGVKVKFHNTIHGTIETKNLINNAGLDMLATYLAADVFTNAQMGTGTRQNARDSSSVLLQQAGNVVTADAPFFTAADEAYKRLLRFNTGVLTTITKYIDSQTVEVSTSASIGSMTGTVYYVEETALETATEITNTYEGTANGSELSFASEVLTIRDWRTFDFGLASGETTRTEFGWGPTAVLGDPVFGRVVEEVTWADGAAMWVEVSLYRKITCDVRTIASIPIQNVSGPGASLILFENATLQNAQYRSSVDTDGTTLAGAEAEGSLLEVKSLAGPNRKMCISEYASALEAANITDASLQQAVTYAIDAYIPGSHEMFFRADFPAGVFSSTAWRTIALWIADQTMQFRILYDSNQTFSGSIDGMTMKKTWGRF